MVFQPPSWVPALPEIPDSVPLSEFMYDERYGRWSTSKARNPYTCGVTGKTYTSKQVPERIDLLARAIAKRLGFSPNEGTEWDRVVAVYSVNTIDYIPVSHAVHRLSGIVTPANAQYSASELEHQLQSSGAKALFTCLPLLETGLKAADAVGIPRSAVFLLPVPGAKPHPDFSSVDDLVAQGKTLPAPPPLSWIKGQGARQTAFLCYSSGTSGLPKAVMISHYNIIANIIQMTLLQSVGRQQDKVLTENVLGILPLSHIYGLTVVAHVSQYRGDQLVILPKFDLALFLKTIQDYQLNFLPVVPPMLIQLITNKDVAAKYNLDCVRCVFSGAAPLGIETQEAANKMFPKWKIGQGYGMTETSPVATASTEIDLVPGSSGGLLPGYKAKLIDAEGKVVTGHDERGELLLQGPSVVLGYLHNEKANAETFVHHADGRWIRTGDEAVVRKSSKGHEHVFITDRIKELIKVKGFQVAPAELEAHLLTHDYVHDCTVIPVPDDRAGEVPKAFVVKSPASSGKSDADIRRAVEEHVEKHKTKYKWLKGGVEFIDAIPKSPSGKILRRVLKDKEKAARKAQGAKL
ncbi:phenylacetyl-CoA ligase [Akanthomyces lecanii RCEF 1005]|uniref:Phenylacetyl-CoA ligase n=1 Tax=Akanthomyces lecanii RCEF 1005 TaxID=1081108 RepID=A0A168FGX5_CORDF|nr:phenylacetyl-CoA ligase [Akanthomyces lecanii RCEF 1005]